MARGKRHTAEQVVNLLRQIEVSVANGNGDTVANGRIVPTAQIVTGSQPKAKRVASFGWPSSLVPITLTDAQCAKVELVGGGRTLRIADL
jgi:hypothetical protein